MMFHVLIFFFFSLSAPDNYQIVLRLGRGHFGEVYKAINTTNNKMCVIKKLRVSIL